MTTDVYLVSDPIGRCPACGAEIHAIKRSMYDDSRMFFTTEWEVPTRCAECGRPLQCKLTERDLLGHARVLEGTVMADRKFGVAKSEQ